MGGRASKPDGVVVFRRGKLPLRVGMRFEEFIQVGGVEGRALEHPLIDRKTWLSKNTIQYLSAAGAQLVTE